MSAILGVFMKFAQGLIGDLIKSFIVTEKVNVTVSKVERLQRTDLPAVSRNTLLKRL